MGKLRDLWAIVRVGRGAPRALLRPEYDRLYPLLRPLAATFRRIAIRRTRVVVVVGSLGKSTTTALLRAALDTPRYPFSFSNYGASLARNLLRLRRGDRHAVLEAGVAGPGPMAEYAAMLRPDIVVVTSIASEHNRSFATLEDTRAEKVRMVRALRPSGLVVLNGDDPHVRWMATQTTARVITVGAGEENSVRVRNVVTAGDSTTDFIVEVAGRACRVRSRLLGLQMIFPFLAVAAVAHAESLDLEEALLRASAVGPEPSRMEATDLVDGTLLIDDSFKAAAESVISAFDAAANVTGRRRVVVLGPVEEPRGAQGELYRELGRRLAAFADLVICTGGRSMSGVRTGAAAAGMDPGTVVLVEGEIGQIVQKTDELRRPGDLILIKGASAGRLNRLAQHLKGMNVSCQVKRCRIKSPSCGACPLVDAPPEIFDNHYVRRATSF